MTQTDAWTATSLTEIRQDALDRLGKLATAEEADAWERDFLGPKGAVKLLQRSLGQLPAEDRPAMGRAANELSRELTVAFEPVKSRLDGEALQAKLQGDAVDVTLPGRTPIVGGLHPLNEMIDELIEIFAHLGFQAVFGPEVESAHYNFDLLNIPADHPARDVWDTIFIDAPNEEIVLRTHTSPMQARTMERARPPVRVIVPGKAFRFEAQDASHEWQFTQLEGLAVDRHIRLSDLKGVLQELARQLFGPERKVRFR
jgi:phenylalanyl-tRNA synthetase alpha chain